MKRKAHIYVRATATCVVCVMILALTGCGSSSHGRAKAKALNACDAWVNAGIGAPNVSPAERKSALVQSLKYAGAASDADVQWDDLREALARADAALAKVHYADRVKPVGVPNLRAIAAACVRAGQKP